MKLIIDASVALKWVLDEPGQAAADALLDDELLAPDLWLIEAANALWKRVGRGELGATEAAALMTELRNAPIATSSIDTDLAEALALAVRLSHPVYDCLYLAMALREDAQVVTADRRFHTAVQGELELRARVRLLE